MVPDIEIQVVDESLPVLGGAPGLSEEPIEIGPEHGAGVVE